MTNAALDRLERISSAPAAAFPERLGDDATFDEKLAYLFQLSEAATNTVLQRQPFEHEVVSLLREIVTRLERLEVIR